MPHKNGMYVSDDDHRGWLRNTYNAVVGAFKPKPTAQKPPSMMENVNKHNKMIKDLTEGKY